jgi:cytochrome c556
MAERNIKLIKENKKHKDTIEFANEYTDKVWAEHEKYKDKAQKYDDLMAANSEVVQHNIDLTKDHMKAARYDMLRDRYLNQNEKHFDELCGEYFDD